MNKVEIRYHIYRCHPETCCHDDHNPWWVECRITGSLLGKFETKNKAITYCGDNDLNFIIKIPQWSEY